LRIVLHNIPWLNVQPKSHETEDDAAKVYISGVVAAVPMSDLNMTPTPYDAEGCFTVETEELGRFDI